MAELIVDRDRMATVVSSLRTAADSGGWQSCPSVSYCGSDQIIEAFVQAFSTIRDQEQNLRETWSNLADGADQALGAFAEADAQLAAG